MGSRDRRIEWPTLGIAAAVYGGFGLLTWHHAAVPAWALFLGGGYIVAWHGSLQHEIVHGHPTPWHRLNEALVLPSLWLWLPFGLYREAHLVHHDDARLTDPAHDPESYYVPAARWASAGPVIRALLSANNTLAGRLLVGPFVCIGRLAGSEVAMLARGDRRHLRHWAVHGAGVALTLAWVIGVCGIPLPAYLALFVYPGISLTLLRSYAEHQAAEPIAARTSIVEAGPLWSLLYLNNNLHVVHHENPGLPWYALPTRWRRDRERYLGANGNRLYRGYGAIIRRHLASMREPVAHPGT